ncbi:hypothetical protein CBR_g64872 [Chara braunii]|uniref:Integrase catalytic domain-containing protein n=1 Tax=Chara braunii TaxID=69332 RepID=A0A388K996_CHABU|nr:hypothetical protein CBR_g64872 [Chara braunii]|eukprot:GBG66599.1 hypothetical protein CBR_g64872 [Chara braunii]
MNGSDVDEEGVDDARLTRARSLRVPHVFQALEPGEERRLGAERRARALAAARKTANAAAREQAAPAARAAAMTSSAASYAALSGTNGTQLGMPTGSTGTSSSMGSRQSTSQMAGSQFSLLTPRERELRELQQVERIRERLERELKQATDREKEIKSRAARLDMLEADKAELEGLDDSGMNEPMKVLRNNMLSLHAHVDSRLDFMQSTLDQILDVLTRPGFRPPPQSPLPLSTMSGPFPVQAESLILVPGINYSDQFLLTTFVRCLPENIRNLLASEARLEYHSFETLSRKALDLEATLGNAQPTQNDTKNKKSPQEWKKKGAKLMMVESDGTQTEIDELTDLMDYTEFDGEEVARGSTLAAVVKTKADGQGKGQPRSQGKAASNQSKVVEWVKAGLDQDVWRDRRVCGACINCGEYGHSQYKCQNAKTLKWIKTQPALSDALKRWIEVIDQYDFKLEYLKGEYNKVADALSRRPDYLGALVSDFGVSNEVTQSLVGAYQEDPVTMDIMRKLQAKDKATESEFVMVDGLLYLDKAGIKRLVVPSSERLRSLFLGECYDATGHFGYKKTSANLVQRFWWPGMLDDAKKYVETYQVCQRDKPRTQAPLGLLKPLPIPVGPGQSASMDFMDTLVTSKSGKRHIFVIIDRFTKYAKLVAMPETARIDYVIKLFKDNWVRDFGLPKSIVSDRDVRFTSELWKKTAEQMGSQLQMTSGNHPEANGQAEQMNRVVQHLLRHYIKPNLDDWDEQLPLIASLYNNAIHSSTGASPNQLHLGWKPRSALDFLLPENQPAGG